MKLPFLYDMFQEEWEQYQSIYFYSDPHFCENDIEAGIPGRPDAEAQLAAINKIVGRKDLLILLGDVGNLDYLSRIRCDIALVLGNHDAGASIYKNKCKWVFEGPVMIAEKLILSHEPVIVPWAYNIHGHCHSQANTAESIKTHYNMCADVIGYQPVHFSKFLKEVSINRHIESLHRTTIDSATVRAARRKKKEKKV